MDRITLPRQIDDNLINVRHFTTSDMKKMLADAYGFAVQKSLISSINAGDVAVRYDGDDYHVYTRCGGRAWTKWMMHRELSTYDYRIRKPVVQRRYKWFPIASHSTAFTGAPYKFSVTNLAPTIMPALTSADTAKVSFTGKGRLVLFSMGRIGIPDITITITSTKSLYKASEINTSLDVSTATEFEPVYSVIAENLPYDNYEVTMTSSGSPVTSCFPIALGIECDELGLAASPGNPNFDRITVFPWKVIISSTSGVQTYYDITGTDAQSSVTHGSVDPLTAGADYLYIGVDQKTSRTYEYEADTDKFDAVTLEFITPNGVTGGTAEVEYWDSSNWQPLTVLENTTIAPGSLPLGQDGRIVFEVPSDWGYCDPGTLGNTGRYIRLGSGSLASIRVATAELRMYWDASEPEFKASDLASEWEFACQDATSGTDFGGGHGNIARQSLSVHVDGLDVSSQMTAGETVAGRSVDFAQTVYVYDDEPPAGAQYGTYGLRHTYGAGGVAMRARLQFTRDVRFHPYSYFLMLPVLPADYYDFTLLGSRGQELTVTISSMVTGNPAPANPAEEYSGFKFRNTTNGYTLGAIQTQAQSSNEYFDYSESKTFALENGVNVKGYQQRSAGANAEVLKANTPIDIENFYYLTPGR